jgi:hypothetical protein
LCGIHQCCAWGFYENCTTLGYFSEGPRNMREPKLELAIEVGKVQEAANLR